jgi:hypothetical protein
LSEPSSGGRRPRTYHRSPNSTGVESSPNNSISSSNGKSITSRRSGDFLTVDRHNAKQRMRYSNDLPPKTNYHRNERSHTDDSERRSQLSEENIPWEIRSYESEGKAEYDISGSHDAFLSETGMFGGNEGFDYTDMQAPTLDEYKKMSSKEREVEDDLIALEHEIGILRKHIF